MVKSTLFKYALFITIYLMTIMASRVVDFFYITH